MHESSADTGTLNSSTPTVREGGRSDNKSGRSVIPPVAPEPYIPGMTVRSGKALPLDYLVPRALPAPDGTAIPIGYWDPEILRVHQEHGGLPIVYAFSLNEGTRRGRLVPLDCAKLTETPGGRDRVMCRVPGTRNKPPVRWVLEEDTARMLRGWRTLCPSEVLVFPAEAMPRYRRRRAGKPIDMSKYGEVLRADLRKAGVTREELFSSEDGCPRLKGHDLRAGYVIYSREAGASDNHISQRTGHTTKAMIDKYDQAAAILKDSGCMELPPVDEMIPEIKDALVKLSAESSAYRRQEKSPSSDEEEGDS